MSFLRRAAAMAVGPTATMALVGRTTRGLATKVNAIKNVAAFEAALKDDKAVLVDFYATWCGPCRMLAPKLESLAESHGDKVQVIKVDCDEVQELAIAHKVSALPTVVLFKQGKEVDRFMGVRDDKFLAEFVKGS